MWNKFSDTRIHAKNSYYFIRKWFLLNPFGGNRLLGEKLQRDAKNSNIIFFFCERPLYEILEYVFTDKNDKKSINKTKYLLAKDANPKKDQIKKDSIKIERQEKQIKK